MSRQQILNAVHREPFEPFVVRSSSGSGYEVRHPENAVLLSDALMVLFDHDEEGWPRQFYTCSLLHIAALEPGQAA